MGRVWGEYGESMRRVWGEYEESMRRVWGEYGECTLLKSLDTFQG
jgi:hypothetical protein